jgi:hypothetical protein
MEMTAGFDDREAGPNPSHIDVTRHENGQYTFIVSRKNPDGRKDERCRFRLHHADVKEIANLASDGKKGMADEGGLEPPTG